MLGQGTDAPGLSHTRHPILFPGAGIILRLFQPLGVRLGVLGGLEGQSFLIFCLDLPQPSEAAAVISMNPVLSDGKKGVVRRNEGEGL